MVTKAIIEELQDRYHARVRIPTLNKVEGAPASTPFEELYIATICCPVGSSPCYSVGDVVFVTFENECYDSPIIIGQLYSANSSGVSDQNFSTLNVDLTCKLPRDTIIGETTANDLKNLGGTVGNIQGQIGHLDDILGCVGDSINNLKEEYKNSIEETPIKITKESWKVSPDETLYYAIVSLVGATNRIALITPAPSTINKTSSTYKTFNLIKFASVVNNELILYSYEPITYDVNILVTRYK